MTARLEPLDRTVAEERERRTAPAPPPRKEDLLLASLPMAAGNYAIARSLAARQPAAAAAGRRLPAQTPYSTPGSGVLLHPERTPTAIAAQLGEDFDAEREAEAQLTPPAPGAGAPAVGAPAALARMAGARTADLITALQILRINGSPGAPGSRAPFEWVVANATSAAPRTRIAILAMTTPAAVTSSGLAALPADDVSEVTAFLHVGSWDDPFVGLPRKGAGRPRALTADQREQVEYIRRRREVVADRGPALFVNRDSRGRARGLEYDGSPAGDPKPSASTPGTLAAEIWKELNREGSAGSVNTYDNQKFTWGKGWSALTHLKSVIEKFFAADPMARQELMEAGFTYSGEWLYVDVNSGQVLQGTEALAAFKFDRKFVSLLIHLAEDPEHRQQFVDAQWEHLSTGDRAGDVPPAVRAAWPNRWTTRSVRFAAHCVHWGRTWREAEAVGPDIKNLIRWIARIKGKQDKSGAWKITGTDSGTIRHFADSAAERLMSAPAPLPDKLDPAAFYFEDGGANSFRVFKP